MIEGIGMDNSDFVKKIQLRLLHYSVRLLTYIDTFPRITSYQVIAKQLARSGTSIGANYAEGQATSSLKEFSNYVRISLKSANETIFWLTIVREMGKISDTELDYLFNETRELSKILGSIVKHTKR